MPVQAPCRFDHAPVPVIASRKGCREIEEALGGSRLGVLRVASVEAARGLSPPRLPFVFHFAPEWGEWNRSLDQLRSLVGACAPHPVIVVVRAGDQAMSALLDLEHVVLIMLPLEARRLGPAVAMERGKLEKEILTTRFELWCRELVSRIVRAKDLDGRLRSALVWIVERRVVLNGAPEGDEGPGRSVKDVADAIGVRPKALRRVASAADVDLRRVLDAWLALLALVLHELEGKGSESIAFGLGYEGISGLSELMLRVYGKRLRALAGDGVEIGLQKVDELFDGLLAA